MGCPQSKEEDSNGAVPIDNEPPPKTLDPRLPFESYRQFFQMKNAWKVVTRAMEATAKYAYIRFFTDHPEYQALHKNIAHLEPGEKMENSTTFEEFAVTLFNALDEAIEAIDKDMVDAAIACLKRIGQVNAKTEGFPDTYYKDFEDAFLKAVQNTMADRYTEPVEQNYRRFYGFASDNIIHGLTGSPPNRI